MITTMQQRRTATRIVSENLRAEMARKGKYRPELATVLGISISAVHHRFAARHSWTVDQLVAMAQWLDVDLKVLLHGISTKEAA
jgi:transcriptional regulator with XRE-family HTH domain